jgi:hypothetical protein
MPPPASYTSLPPVISIADQRSLHCHRHLLPTAVHYPRPLYNTTAPTQSFKLHISANPSAAHIVVAAATTDSPAVTTSRPATCRHTGPR